MISHKERFVELFTDKLGEMQFANGGDLQSKLFHL